jgi:hypothetical protein
MSFQEIEDLWRIQQQRMTITGNESVAFADIMRQLADTIRPGSIGAITVQDLLSCKQADMFFEMLVDLQKFLVREYEWPPIKPEFEEGTGPLSPWELFVLVAYDELLSAGH